MKKKKKKITNNITNIDNDRFIVAMARLLLLSTLQNRLTGYESVLVKKMKKNIIKPANYTILILGNKLVLYNQSLHFQSWAISIQNISIILLFLFYIFFFIIQQYSFVFVFFSFKEEIIFGYKILQFSANLQSWSASFNTLLFFIYFIQPIE